MPPVFFLKRMVLIMNGSKIERRPAYRLLKQSDVVSYFHMQMPRWLFFDPKYVALSLEAKVAYTFLLNRFQLSRMNGWINKSGEVYLIFPRKKLAEEMGISYRKAIQCFKELLAADLIWEHRIGRGKANHIYMAAVELSETASASHSSAPFVEQFEPESRNAETAGHDDVLDPVVADIRQGARFRAPLDDVPETQAKKCYSSRSESAEFADLEVSFLHPSKKEDKKIDDSQTETVSLSGRVQVRDKPTDPEEEERLLDEILASCELDILPEEEAGVFCNAITRLFYSDSFRVGGAVLPQSVIRSHLCEIDGTVLLDTREKLRQNRTKQVKNSTAYVMTTLLNNIWETKSDLMVDPYLNSLGSF